MIFFKINIISTKLMNNSMTIDERIRNWVFFPLITVMILVTNPIFFHLTSHLGSHHQNLH